MSGTEPAFRRHEGPETELLEDHGENWQEGELSRERKGELKKEDVRMGSEMLTQLMLGVGGSPATAPPALLTQCDSSTASYLSIWPCPPRLCPCTSDSLCAGQHPEDVQPVITSS